MSLDARWPKIANLDSVASPGLLVDAERVAGNIQAMVQMVQGQPARLRPHVKTHKMTDVLRLQVGAGITKFKAATLSEAKMAAAGGGTDVLVSYQLVGPNVRRLATLVKQFPDTSFATLTDDIQVAETLAKDETLAKELGDAGRPLRLFIDVDCGMHRTGIPLGPDLDRLRTTIESLRGVEYAGLHVYDGHLHSPSQQERTAAAGEIIEEIRKYQQANPSPTIVGGGSPTFPCWATETPWECSPGTPVFWDQGYGGSFPELGFSIAVALLTRVISKPGGNRLCLDLGYKSVASEMPLDRRVVIPAIGDATFVGHSEEHLVLETAAAQQISIGQDFLAFPRHICPTVALHSMATVVRQGQVTSEKWPVTARDR